MTAIFSLNDGGFFIAIAAGILLVGGLLYYVTRKKKRESLSSMGHPEPESLPTPEPEKPKRSEKERKGADAPSGASNEETGSISPNPVAPAPAPAPEMTGGVFETKSADELEIEEVVEESPKPVGPVDFAVFAPEQLTRGAVQLVDVWAFEKDHFDEIKELAAELGQDSVAGIKSGVPVALDSRLVLEFSIPSLDVENQLDEIHWLGDPTNVSFAVPVPDDAHLGGHLGEVGIFVHGARLARIRFALQVGEEEAKEKNKIAAEVVTIKRAFASYASEDRAEVLGRIQGMKTVFPDLDIFVDALSLQAGDDWDERLKKEVVNRDVLYLFWSENAAESEYVEKEWRLALENRGIDYIDPVPLQIPSVAPPPQDLSALHFADAYATYAYLSQ